MKDHLDAASSSAITDSPTVARVTTGSVLNPAAMAVLEARLRQSYSGESADSNDWLKLLLPPLQGVDDLMSLAWEVLDGSPHAAALFRKVLLGFAGGAEQTRIFPRVLGLFEPETPQCGGGAGDHTTDPVPRVHPLAPTERLLPIMAATAVAAQGPTDMARLFGALELGLGGLSELALIYDAGVDLPDLKGSMSAALAWDTAMRSAAGRLGFGPLPLRGWRGPGGRPGEPGAGGIPLPGNGWSLPDVKYPVPGPGLPGRPIPDPGKLPADPSRIVSMFDAFELCLFELIPRIRSRGRGVDFFFPPGANVYVIESVTPEHACPGATVIVTGAGFEGTEHVAFSGPGRRTVPAEPDEVAAGRIVVRVPAEAVTGPVWLYVPERVTLCHGMSVTMARPGTPGTFTAGRARVAHFAFGAGSCAIIDHPAILSWAVEPDDARVLISEIDAMWRREIWRGSGPTGSLSIDTPTLGHRTFTIEARNPHATCPAERSTIELDVDGPAPILTIVGVEVTQGIQRFSLDQPDDPTNNSLRVIGGKDTAVRVFVRSDRGGYAGDVARVTGLLRASGRTFMPINTSPFIDAGPAPRRWNIDDSLNFLIPGALAYGFARTLDIQVFSTEGCPTGAFAQRRHTVDWSDLPPLPVTIRRIADPGTGDVISEADALDNVRRAFNRLPSTAAEIRLRPGVFTINEDTTEANYCHDGGFYQLALSVAYEHNGVEGHYVADLIRASAGDPTISRHDTVWIGLFFQSDCTAGGMMSWPFNSTCISRANDVVAAHELAHCVGMGHTPSGNGEKCADAFQPVPCHWLPHNGWISEVIFDIPANALQLVARDLMTYAPEFRFLHPDHWERVRDGMDSFIAASRT